MLLFFSVCLFLFIALENESKHRGRAHFSKCLAKINENSSSKYVTMFYVLV